MTTHSRFVDVSAVSLAVVAGINLSSAALIATILAALGSLSLVVLRWYLFFKYGPQGSDDE